MRRQLLFEKSNHSTGKKRHCGLRRPCAPPHATLVSSARVHALRNWRYPPRYIEQSPHAPAARGPAGEPSFPIPLRILIAAHPELLTPLLRIIHRVIAGFQLKQTGLKRAEAGAPRALKVRFPTLSTSAAGRKYEWRFSVSGRSEAPARFFSTDQVQCRQCDEQLTYEAPNFNDCNGRTSGYRQAHPRAHGGRVDVTVGHPGARAAGAGYRIGVG